MIELVILGALAILLGVALILHGAGVVDIPAEFYAAVGAIAGGVAARLRRKKTDDKPAIDPSKLGAWFYAVILPSAILVGALYVTTLGCGTAAAEKAKQGATAYGSCVAGCALQCLPAIAPALNPPQCPPAEAAPAADATTNTDTTH